MLAAACAPRGQSTTPRSPSPPFDIWSTDAFRRLTWPFDEWSPSSAGVYALGHVPSRHSDTTGMSRDTVHRCLETSLISGPVVRCPGWCRGSGRGRMSGPAKHPEIISCPLVITDDGRTWLARDDEGPHGPTGRRPRGDGKHHRGPTHRGRVVAPDVHRSPPKACAYVASRPSDTELDSCSPQSVGLPCF